MRKFLVGALIAILTALPISSRAAEPVAWEPVLELDRQVFPSLLLATATIQPDGFEPRDESSSKKKRSKKAAAPITRLGDPHAHLGIRLQAPADNTPIRVEIRADEFCEPSVFEGTLKTSGSEYVIFPKLKYKYHSLLTHRQAQPVAVTFAVQIGRRSAGEKTENVTLRSLNDCPFYVAADEPIDLSFMFAAYVNEDHPYVDQILKAALETEAVDSFTGYQSGDPVEVYRQVFAVWEALSELGVRYSDISTTANNSQLVSSQHVRLLDDSVNAAQANCVDGSVLLASVLRKIGIEPYLVFVPGHCLLAFALDEDGDEIVALETTLIGSQGGDEYEEIEGLLDALGDEDWQDENSWATFHEALESGAGSLETVLENVDQDSTDYQLVSIAACREAGVKPIAYKKTAETSVEKLLPTK